MSIQSEITRLNDNIAASYSAAAALGAEMPAEQTSDNLAATIASIWAIPAGGTVGQVLSKQSDTDGDVGWVDDKDTTYTAITNEQIDALF